MAKGPRTGLTLQVKTQVELFPDRIDALVNTPDGPVGRRVEFVAGLILKGAIPRIGDRYSGHHPGPLLKDSGKVVSVGGSSYAVVFDHPAAFIHHEGTKSHSIGEEGKILVNRHAPATSSGGSFFAKKAVDHPGTTGNPYMREAADELGLRASGSLQRGNRPTRIFRLRPV